MKLDCLDSDEEPVFDSVAQIEMDLLLEAVTRRYGYDFSQYSNKMLRRRLTMFRNYYQVKTLSELIPLVLYDQEVMGQLLRIISITVTEFFRDPKFFMSFNQQVIPLLHTYAFISLWCAGCASGEEAYSWAILLDEAGLLERSRIYATDINSNALQEGREGIYSEENYLKANNNYRLMGGKKSFEDYCRRSYGAIKMADRLKKHITFARHNLVHDGVFGEMTVVSCRNVMIYFGSPLKQRSIDLFYKSLCSQGFLCLGDSETIETTDFSSVFQSKDKSHRIYQKIHELKE